MSDVQSVLDEAAIRASAGEQYDIAFAKANRQSSPASRHWWQNRASLCLMVKSGYAVVDTTDPNERDVTVFHPNGPQKSAGIVRRSSLHRMLGWYTTAGEILPIR